MIFRVIKKHIILIIKSKVITLVTDARQVDKSTLCNDDFYLSISFILLSDLSNIFLTCLYLTLSNPSSIFLKLNKVIITNKHKKMTFDIYR